MFAYTIAFALSVVGTLGNSCPDGVCESEPQDEQALLQTAAQTAILSRDGKSTKTGCAAIWTDNGASYSTSVSFGTPWQEISLIVDTGSNSIVVASCNCSLTGACSRHQQCFDNKNASSTFELQRDADGEPISAQLYYGSGEIDALLCTDVVKVGDITASMKQGIMLMTDNELSMSGSFQGIFGLGVPISKKMMKMEEHMSDVVETPGFLQQDKIERFSLCMDGQNGGALRMGIEPLQGSLKQIGTEHWGLGFYGLSVGAGAGAAQFLVCTEADMYENQETPCGVIPDSGTTLIMGPLDQLEVLFGAICDAWPRCQTQDDSAGQGQNGRSPIGQRMLSRQRPGIQPGKAVKFAKLVEDCNSWLDDDGAALDELPPIHFKLGDLDGNFKTVTLPASIYIMQMEDPSGAGKGAGDTSKICMPAFDEMNYETAANGDVWILGLPLFQNYRVGFDQKAGEISFDAAGGGAGCALCSESGNSDEFLLSQSQENEQLGKSRKKLHMLKGSPRVRSLVKSRPL